MMHDSKSLITSVINSGRRNVNLVSVCINDEQIPWLLDLIAARSQPVIVLNLQGNEITDTSVPFLLSFLENVPNMQVLNLGSNCISLNGLEKILYGVLENSNLKAVRLDGNPGVTMIDPGLILEVNSKLRCRIIKSANPPSKSTPKIICASGRNQLPQMYAQAVHVAIVGGGIGGLALAIALGKYAIPCTVFEKDSSFDIRHQGYGLTLQQGSRSIRALGLSDSVAQVCTWSHSHFIFDHEGNVVSFWGVLKSKGGSNSAGLQVDGAGEREEGDGQQQKQGKQRNRYGTKGRTLAGHNLHIPRQVSPLFLPSLEWCHCCEP
jgi:hypothetical protein